MATVGLYLQKLFYKPAKFFVEVSQVDSQKTPEEKPNEFLCPKTVLFLSPDLIGFEYAIYDD